MKNRLPVLVYLIIALFLSGSSLAQTTWSKAIGGDLEELGRSVQQTTDGGYIIVGNTASYGAGENDIWLVKTDGNGIIQWSRTFGGAGDEFGESVHQTVDGGYILGGVTSSFGAGDWDAWLIKTDANGIEEWNRTIGDDGRNYLYEIQRTSDGGYVLIGNTDSDDDEAQIWLVKTDASGNPQWSQNFGGNGDDSGFSVEQTTDGGYILNGITPSLGAGQLDAWLIKTDADGSQQWNKTFGGSDIDRGASVHQTADGGFIITGSTRSYGAGRGDAWLIKTDGNGIEQWSYTFGGTLRDDGLSVQQTTDGGYILTGRTMSFGHPDGEAWLVKTDGNGIEQWTGTFGLSPSTGWAVQQTTDGGYIVAGVTGQNLFLIKTDASGHTLSIEATAREPLAMVTLRAKNVAADAQLIFVTTPIDLPQTGRAGHWMYFFKSESQQKLYEFWYQNGDILQQDPLTVQEGTVDQSMNPLPESWIDSEEALAVAEANGGSDFRGTYGDWRIGATLLPPGSEYPGSVWLVMYGSESKDLVVVVDAVTGTIYEIPVFTARERLSQVDTAAKALVADAQLIFVHSPSVNPEGEAEKWYFIYKSSGLSEIYEYWAWGDLVEKSEQRTVMDGRIRQSRPALPESWIDSDAALIVAEQNSGSEFRQTFDDVNIDVDLTKYESGEAGCVRPTWQVFYVSPDSVMVVRVDAIFGTTYDNLPRVTAREKLASVEIETANANIPADAQLVFVRADRVDPDGKSDHWYYVYESAGEDTLYEFWIYGGQAEQRVRHALDWLQPGMTPIPDFWMDSDSAIFVAEQEGGNEFRQTHDNWMIEMDLQTFGQGSSKLMSVTDIRAMWNLYYHADDGASANFNVIAVIDTSASDRSKTTAREKLASVDSAAVAVAADALLIYVRAHGLDSSGKSGRWKYIYESADRQTRYEFWILNGQVVRQDELTIHWLQPDMTAIPEYWIDSDSAVANAERKGGKAFREMYSDWNIEMDLHAFSEGMSKQVIATGLNAVWNIYYNRPSGPEGTHVEVNALSNLPDYLKTTARGKLASVGASAVNVAPDAQLIYVSGNDLNLEGKSAYWYYIYQSLDQQSLYEFWVLNTQVMQSDPVTITDQALYLGMPALPDRWADSDVAVDHAEQNGGIQFRENNEEWTVRTRLYTPLNEGPRWELFYDSSTNFRQINVDAFTHVDSEHPNSHMPASFQLFQNYPNPFNPITTIRYEIPQKYHIRIRVIDLLGHEVALLQDGEMEPGSYSVIWDGQDVKGKRMGSGIYLYELKGSSFRQVRRMLLIR